MFPQPLCIFFDLALLCFVSLVLIDINHLKFYLAPIYCCLSLKRMFETFREKLVPYSAYVP